jgi:hypothetical protein
VLVDSNYLVECVRDLASHACPVVGQVCGKIAALECRQGGKQLLAIEPIAVKTRSVWPSRSGGRGIFHMD